jgi:undecaprenyl-diphosphatase
VSEIMVGPFGEAAVLGIVHGATEFLPLSSGGHLALAEILFKLDGSAALRTMLRVGTLAATLIVLWSEVARTASGGVRALVRPSRAGATPGAGDALVVLLASVPSAVIGLTLRAPVGRWTESPLAIGLGFLGTTAALVLAHFAGPGERDQPTARGALLLGVAQGLAVLPGLSRSGATIAVALLLGVRPMRAFELSMLISLPALLGATALESREALAAPFPGASVLVGGLAALGTGVISLHALRGIVAQGRVAWFAFWVGPLALATMAMGLAWPA